MADKALVAPPINGQQCVHMSYSRSGMVQCTEAAQQENVAHGWLCDKHYWTVRNKPHFGRDLQESRQ